MAWKTNRDSVPTVQKQSGIQQTLTVGRAAEVNRPRMPRSHAGGIGDPSEEAGGLQEVSTERCTMYVGEPMGTNGRDVLRGGIPL